MNDGADGGERNPRPAITHATSRRESLIMHIPRDCVQDDAGTETVPEVEPDEAVSTISSMGERVDEDGRITGVPSSAAVHIL